MCPFRNLLMGLATWLLAATSVFAHANSALDIVPADALGFAFVNNLEEANAKVEAMLKQLKVPLEGSPLKKALAGLGITKGINEKGSVVVAAIPGEQPIGLYVVPVSNYKAFGESLKAKDTSGKITPVETALGQPFAMGKKGDYAVLVEAEHKDVLKKVLNGKGGIAEVVNPLQGWIADNDLGLVITSKGMGFLPKICEGLGQLKNLPLSADDAESLGPMLDSVSRFLEKYVAEVTLLAVGGKFAGKGDLVVDVQALFAKGGSFAKLGAQAKGMAGGPLAGLPAGPFVFAGGGGLSGLTMQSFIGWGGQIITAGSPDLPEELAKKLEQAAADIYQGVSGVCMVMGVGNGGESLFGAMMIAMKVDDSAAYMKRYEKAAIGANEVYKTGKISEQKPLELKKVKVGQVPALEFVNDLSESPNQVPSGFGTKFDEVLIGEGGKLRATVVPADDTTILIGYTSRAGMKKALSACRNKKYLSDDAELAKTATMLPKGAQWAGYFSPKGAIEVLNRVGAGFLPIQLPAFPETPPVGAGLKLSESRLEIRIVVPAAVLEGIGNLVQLWLE